MTQLFANGVEMGNETEEEIVLLITWIDGFGDSWIFSTCDMARADAMLTEMKTKYQDVRINARWEKKEE